MDAQGFIALDERLPEDDTRAPSPRITEEVKGALRAIEDASGRLTPEGVVEAAADTASPLHRFFEWSNRTAAHSWRIEQARVLLRRVRVVIETTEVTFRAPAYVRTPGAESSEAGYTRIERIITAPLPLEREALVCDEIDRILALVARSKDVLAAALPGSEEALTDVAVALLKARRRYAKE